MLYTWGPKVCDAFWNKDVLVKTIEMKMLLTETNASPSMFGKVSSTVPKKDCAPKFKERTTKSNKSQIYAGILTFIT